MLNYSLFSTDPRPRRFRDNFSPADVHILEQTYKRNKYPNLEIRQNLSKRLQEYEPRIEASFFLYNLYELLYRVKDYIFFIVSYINIRCEAHSRHFFDISWIFPKIFWEHLHNYILTPWVCSTLCKLIRVPNRQTFFHFHLIHRVQK